MLRKFGNITLEVLKGDITKQEDLSVVVNAANAELSIGGGVAGAIHRAAGPELDRECQSLAPILPGEAVMTKAYGLPNDYIIHCLGPVYGVDQPEDEILANCYKEALRLAEECKMDSIGFPAISTGAFGYPIEEASKVAVQTILKKVAELQYLKRIRFVLFSDRDKEVFEKRLSE